MAGEAWRQYQRDAAALLGELGFTTAVEEKITSARGVTHEIDVSARRNVAGVEILWVVECKFWRTPIGKEKVAALAAICDDIGADRGLIMSEKGFQSGAWTMATGRSISLTSLEDLRSKAAADLFEARVYRAERRLCELEAVVLSRQPYRLHHRTKDLGPALQLFAQLVPEEQLRPFASEAAATTCSTMQDVDVVVARLLCGAQSAPGEAETLHNAIFDGQRAVVGREPALRHHMDLLSRLDWLGNCLDGVRVGRWPVVVTDNPVEYRSSAYSDHSLRIAWTPEQLLDLVEPVLTDCEEHALTRFKRRQRETHQEFLSRTRDTLGFQ